MAICPDKIRLSAEWGDRGPQRDRAPLWAGRQAPEQGSPRDGAHSRCRRKVEEFVETHAPRRAVRGRAARSWGCVAAGQATCGVVGNAAP